MRHFLSLAAFAALATAKELIASPSPADFVKYVNGTHFVDPATNKTYQHFDCDVTLKNATSHFKAGIQRLHQKHLASAHGARAATALTKKQVQTPIAVKAYFHVITTTAKAGTITQQMANDQLTALNAAYSPIGVTFTLAGTDSTTNDAWAVANGTDMDALKQALRKGTYADLNLYFHSDLTGGILGTCTLPSQVPVGADPSTYVSDGCNLAAGTMPGGNIGGYNKGGTAIHETGHWLGLLHTFEGYACSGDGDLIADTPFESVSTQGCPSKPAKDSCPSTTGVDPIHNYMDYSTDACYTNFTPGQVARIGTLWTQYRQGQ
ncbi:hypothetical protein LTR95_018019 [Oleoguttula sp. CCFEE 5521]